MKKYFTLCALLFLASACTPRVEVGVPDKPITINLNVKVEHEIKVAIAQELETLFAEEEQLF